MGFECVGIIGAGVMGCGTAADLVLRGINVTLVDVSIEILNEAMKRISNDIKLAALLDKSCQAITMKEVSDRIKYSVDIKDVEYCDFIIENTSEKWETKEAVIMELNRLSGLSACIGINTSCFSITRIGSIAKRPDKIIGMHFMNPVYLKSFVEVVKGSYTSEETIDNAKAFLRRLNKSAVIVNDSPGFVSNRISHLFMNEAAFVVQEQVADPRQVDEIFKRCYGHAMGPLATADLIGLDTVVNTLDALYDSYKDSKFRCCTLLRKMVYAGYLGRKSGKGFYVYND